jgi:hypothetical protein
MTISLPGYGVWRMARIFKGCSVGVAVAVAVGVEVGTGVDVTVGVAERTIVASGTRVCVEMLFPSIWIATGGGSPLESNRLHPVSKTKRNNRIPQLGRNRNVIGIMRTGKKYEGLDLGPQ